MTNELDKQIIIDGVDVSRCSDISGHVNDFGEYECLCRCIFGDGSDDYGVIGHEMCKDNPNCHYKNWQRQERRCDMWENIAVDNGAVALKYQQQLDQLKAERGSYIDKYFLESQKVINLKKVLIEIKEIAEHCMKQDICTTCDNSEQCHIEDEEVPTYDVCKLVLQKISEV